jgi:hypothetical protein
MKRFLLMFCCLASTHIACTADEKCVSAPDGLVAWWRGDDTAQDLNPDVTPDFVNVDFVEGKVGKALRFSTAGTYLRVPASPKLDVGLSNGFSLEMWINPVDNTVSQPLFEWGNSGEKAPGVHLWIHDGAGRLFANLVDDKGGYHFLSSGPGIIKPNLWQHIALTYDKNGTASLYRNGVLMAQADIGSLTPKTSGDLYFGLRPSDEARRAFYNGSLDEISVYNKPLTQKHIEEIYRADSAGKCDKP